MNRKGQAIFYTLMLGVVIIILALAFAPAILEFSTSARAPDSDTAVGLDCANTTISDFDKASCILTDLSTPFFIGFMIALVGIIIGGRIIFGS